jgi:hypothetical protein
MSDESTSSISAEYLRNLMKLGEQAYEEFIENRKELEEIEQTDDVAKIAELEERMDGSLEKAIGHFYNLMIKKPPTKIFLEAERYLEDMLGSRRYAEFDLAELRNLLDELDQIKRLLRKCKKIMIKMERDGETDAEKILKYENEFKSLKSQHKLRREKVYKELKSLARKENETSKLIYIEGLVKLVKLFDPERCVDKTDIEVKILKPSLYGRTKTIVRNGTGSQMLQ